MDIATGFGLYLSGKGLKIPKKADFIQEALMSLPKYKWPGRLIYIVESTLKIDIKRGKHHSENFDYH